jgi:hypothetical protein
VIAGICLSVAGYRSGVELTPDLIFTLFLPPLVFEAALHLGWRQFCREAPLVLNLAFVGTILGTIKAVPGLIRRPRSSRNGATVSKRWRIKAVSITYEGYANHVVQGIPHERKIDSVIP